jgi:hypothetical protein
MLHSQRQQRPEHCRVKMHVQMAVNVRKGQSCSGKAVELGRYFPRQFPLGSLAREIAQASAHRILWKAAVLIYNVWEQAGRQGCLPSGNYQV